MPLNLSSALDAALVPDSERAITFPCHRFQRDIIGFTRTILGMDPWEKQREMLLAIQDKRFAAFPAGRKVGKTTAIAIGCLWAYCSFDDGCAIVTSVTEPQLQDDIWRKEIRKQFLRSGKCFECRMADPRNRMPVPCPHSAQIDGKIGDNPDTGLWSADGRRSVIGKVTRDAGGMQGTSGAELFYFVDEASHAKKGHISIIKGNIMGLDGPGGLFMFGNPECEEGPFYDALAGADSDYTVVPISSLDSPNVIAGKTIIRGLATREGVEAIRRQHGEDSLEWICHVLGKVPERDTGKVLARDLLAAAVNRWEQTPASGRLYIGLDVAGEGGDGDDSVACMRRGQKILGFERNRGLDEDAHLSWVLEIIKRHYVAGEAIPVVVLDREGSIGTPLYGVMRKFLQDNRYHPQRFHLVPARASDASIEPEPRIYDRVRDQLWASMAQWLKDGGAIPEDSELLRELKAPSWLPRSAHNRGRLKVTDKPTLRKMLGRSPDKADAACLAVFEHMPIRDSDEIPKTFVPPQPQRHSHERTFSPYRTQRETEEAFHRR